ARERVGILIVSLRLALLLGLPEFPIERAHFHEINIAGGFLSRNGVVASLRVIRNEIARLKLELFEEKRVSARQGMSRVPPEILKLNSLLFSAVDRKIKLERGHTVVIFRANLGEYLLDAGDFHIAAGLVDHDRRRVIFEQRYVV